MHGSSEIVEVAKLHINNFICAEPGLQLDHGWKERTDSHHPIKCGKMNCVNTSTIWRTAAGRQEKTVQC